MGKQYDNAMKSLCARVPEALCRWLGMAVTDEVSALRIYLRDLPVEPFLADAELAPLAVLADVAGDERRAVLERAAELISGIGDVAKREVLAQVAADLAELRMDVDIIKSIWEDHAMPFPSFTEAYAAKRANEGYQHGLEEGREEGRVEDRVQMVSAMLRHKFGPDERISAVARRLTALEPEDIYRRCDEATSLDDLLDD